MAINNITITQVNVSHSAEDEEKYDLKVFWKQDEIGQGTVSNYWLILYKDKLEDSNISFTGTGVQSFTNLSFDKDSVYEISLTASLTKYTPCNKVPLLFDSYEHISARYTNSEITLTWEQSKAITMGRVTFASEGHPSRSYPISGEMRHLRMDLSDVDLKSQTVWNCSLLPAKSETSWGPVPDDVVFYVEPAKLISIDREEKKIKVTYELSDAAYQKKDGIYAKLVLLMDGKVVFSTNPAIVTEKANKQFSLEANVTDQFVAANLTSMKLAVFIGTKNATNVAVTNQNAIPLAAPTITFDYAAGKKVILSWKHDGEGCTGYTAYKDGKPLTGKHYAKECSLNALEALNGKMTVSPDYGGIRGVTSNAVMVFRKGFYPCGQGFCLYADAYGENATSVTLPQAIFSEAVTAEIESGAFRIKPEGTAYQLSFDRNAEYKSEDFDAFLNQLFEKKLTVAGYYTIRNVLSRIVTTVGEKSLYMFASMKRDALYADVVPGTILRTETAYYQRQLGANEDDGIGYIRGAETRYPVTLGVTGSTNVLEFGKYIGFVAGSYTGTGAVDDPYRYNYGGQVDLFHGNVRQPFVRILYPSALPDSKEPGTPYASKNILLLTAATFGVLKENTEAARTEITTPYVVLRGRSTVVPEITVFVDDSPTVVELGTSLDDLLDLYSHMGEGRDLRMFRETGTDIGLVEMIVQMNEAADYANGLALLPGDRIYLNR